MTIVFLLLCVAVLVYGRTAYKNRVDIECFSVFTKDTEGERKLNVAGEVYLKLNMDGTGMFYINASSSVIPILVAKRTYYFNYMINNKGVLNTELVKMMKTPSDNVDEKTFVRYIQNLGVKSSGNLTVSKFKNIYVIRYPGFIVHTCT